MSEYILFFVILLTSIVGVIEIIKTITEVLFFKKSSTKTISLLPLNQTAEEIEYAIRGALFKTNGQLIVVDMGIDDGAYRVLDKLKEDCNRLFVIKKEELNHYLGAVG